MKPGRNDLCPCGSGRKYKHCCLAKDETVVPDELTWPRVRPATETLGSDLLREAARHFGPAALDEAWDEFTLYEEEAEPFDDDSPYSVLFFTWFLYDWLPDPHDTEVPPSAHGVTAAQAYLARAGDRLDAIAQRYVDACRATPFSFHEVIDSRAGHGMRLRDVMTGTETEVMEKTASRSLRACDIVFAKAVPIEGIALIEGMGPVAVPPMHKPALIELRHKLGTHGDLFGVERLREYDIELRGLYLSLADAQLNPAPPELRNTDGEPIEWHTLVFDLDAPETAVGQLSDLAAGVSEPQIERDAAGQLLRAELAWAKPGNAMHKDWDNTTLGHIRIDGTRLTAEVNSARRAAALRKLIEDRLGDSARLKPSIVQSVQSMLERAPAPQVQGPRDRKQAELAAQPEVQAALQEHLRRHYRGWVDTQLPALGKRTPREAVRDPDGREAVEALIRQIERHDVGSGTPLDAGIVRELRHTLGLPLDD
jgi:SEC-C motif